ncbi:MAG: hypothetical protein AAF243_00260 [Cyanobacteria bacterium P01_A01_bin.137]
MPTLAADHDFKPTQTLTPVGIYLPQYDRLYLFFVTSKVTADCLVDLLEQWWNNVKVEFHQIQKWMLNLDNGPENQSRRTQFMFRLVQWVNREHIPLQLAYFLPITANIIPLSAFGWLEQHWNGALLDSIETVLNFAATLTFKGNHPVVTLITQIDETEISLSASAMDELENSGNDCQD